MGLFTVILEYAGGTYVSQNEAEGHVAALEVWLSQLDRKKIAGAVSGEVAAAFAGEIDPVPLAGVVNVWCDSANADRGLAIVNVVRTVN